MLNAMHIPELRARHRLAMANPEVRAKMSAVRRLAMAPGSPIRDKIGSKLGWLSLKTSNDIVERLRLGDNYGK
ncbi:MAG TPA: hypothetical protein VNY06_05640, partial [Methylocella sp.]|nr:hypothetical protein [Methylocella sp.]